MIAKRDIISPLPLIQHPPALLYHQLMAVNCPKQLGFGENNPVSIPCLLRMFNGGMLNNIMAIRIKNNISPAL
ncbi:MAG: hypothetical protein P8X58_14590, partial [Syntrophobacterales bacterium]